LPADEGGRRVADPLTPTLLPAGDGRLHSGRRRVRLGDVSFTGRARLDSIARWAQDIASDDLRCSGVDDGAVWVVRRTTMVLERRPRFGEEVEVATWVTGTGAAWAERRTSVIGREGGSVQAVALWVALDPATFRPRPMAPEFVATWGPSARRPVRARLLHGRPPASPATRDLQLRLADYDMAGHVNNALAWAVLESEVAVAAGPQRRVAVASIEYPAAIDPGARVGVHARADTDDVWCWLLGAGGQTLVSAGARTEAGAGIAGRHWPPG
jgi:acyl-ACP thioesterase